MSCLFSKSIIKAYAKSYKRISIFALVILVSMIQTFVYPIIPAVILAILNSWYWYRKGYRGGKILFSGLIAFYALSILIIKLINNENA